MKVYGLSADNLIDILKVIPWVKIFKTIDSSNYMRVYILACVIPFNIVVSTLVSTITFIVYKKVSNVFHKFEEKAKKKKVFKPSFLIAYLLFTKVCLIILLVEPPT